MMEGYKGTGSHRAVASSNAKLLNFKMDLDLVLSHASKPKPNKRVLPDDRRRHHSLQHLAGLPRLRAEGGERQLRRHQDLSRLLSLHLVERPEKPDVRSYSP